jgi:hypothetical protein
MTLVWIAVAAVAVFALLAALLVYIVPRAYVARSDRAFMTHDERGFKRALKGKGVLWDFEESIVKGAEAPQISFVALDPTTGGRRAAQLLDPKTGSVNLRPQYCVPLPFNATTADAHSVVVEARVQFSLNRDLLKHVYQLEDFGLALETRIHSAFRAEIGKRNDEDLRAALHAVETAVVEQLRQAERDGDESGEPGMALGANIHTASFTYVQADEFAAAQPMTISAPGGAPAVDGAPPAIGAARSIVRAQGVLGLRPQQLDQLADVFKNRDPAATKALLAILEMQTRQNIAESLASSGHLVVVTSQELGLTGASAQREAALRPSGEVVLTPAPNGGARPEARP